MFVDLGVLLAWDVMFVHCSEWLCRDATSNLQSPTYSAQPRLAALLDMSLVRIYRDKSHNPFQIKLPFSLYTSTYKQEWINYPALLYRHSSWCDCPHTIPNANIIPCKIRAHRHPPSYYSYCVAQILRAICLKEKGDAIPCRPKASLPPAQLLITERTMQSKWKKTNTPS